MSGTQEIITRRSRGERQNDGGDDGRPGVTIEQPDQISPEDALADARRQVQESERQTAVARRQAREAQQIAQRAGAQAHEAQTARVSDRETAVNSVVESAKAEVVAAKAAYRAAREVGDVDAEIAAQDAMQSANYRLAASVAELDRIKAAPKPKQADPQQQVQQTNNSGMSAEAQAWADSHPAFNSDRRYRALAVAAHEEAVERGLAVDSPSYFDHINQAMAEEYGEDHGQTGGQKQVQQPRQRQPSARDNAGDGLPPSRHAGGAGGGYKTLSTPLGDIQYRMSRTGVVESVKFPSADTMDNFRQGAETSFRRLYEDNPDKAIAEFATETIAEYLEGGETIKNGEGRILR